MKKNSPWSLLVALMIALMLSACGGPRTQVASGPPPRGGHDGYQSPAAGGGEAARSPAPVSSDEESTPNKAAALDRSAPEPGERPGLGTGWGERRTSRIRHTPFNRADRANPTAGLAVRYNDRSGARAMTRADDYRQLSSAKIPVQGLNVEVSLNRGDGTPLKAIYADGRHHAIGEAGQRYTIFLRNRTDLRLEVVASVDGLDVLDGKSASRSKRGYLIQPHGTLEIAGWRQSKDHVAAFRFSAVKSSYAAQTATDRNVGVIGIALFHERGADPRSPWTRREIRRRQQADPFPNRYASPPPVRLVH